MVQLSANLWWFWLTILSSILVSCYQINTKNSEQYLYVILTKLIAITMISTIAWLITRTLCQRSQSLATLQLYSSTQDKPRNPSFKYGLLTPTQSFKWIEQTHLNYVEKNLPNNGAYTVLRTVDKYNLFQFKMHLQRLLNTIYQQKNLEIPSKILRKMLIFNIRDGLDEFYQDDIIKADEARIMIYIDSIKLYKLMGTKQSKKKQAMMIDDEIENCLEKCIVIHFGALPNLKRPISACIRIGRHVFEHGEKSTSWAKDRNKFHKDIDKQLGLNEIIMTEIDKKDDGKYVGYVMEGLSSNFAVLKDDMSLLTASEDMGILGGTVRGFVIDILNELKDDKQELEKYGTIPNKIVFGKPIFSDIMKWKGVVIMSTSRLLVPIDNLYIDVDDEMLLRLVDGDENHPIFKIEKSNDCGCQYRKIVFGKHTNNDDNHNTHQKDDYLENMRMFVSNHMKSESHSVYVGSVFNK